MGDPLRPAALDRRIEIGVEDAGRPTELKLEARPFADLERRLTEPLDELARRHSKESASDVRRLRRRLDRLWRPFRFRLGPGCAGGDEEGGSEGEAAHRPTMAARLAACKLAR